MFICDDYYSSKTEIEAAANELQDAINQRNSDLVTEKQFAYAIKLIHGQSSDVRKGVSMLKELSNIPACKRDAVFYLARAYYRLKEVDFAAIYIDHALENEPINEQMLQLKAKITKLKENENKVTLGLIGGAAVAVFGLAGLAAWGAYMASRKR